MIDRVDFNPKVLLLKLAQTILLQKSTGQGWSWICGEWKLGELFGKGRNLLDREIGSALTGEPLGGSSRHELSGAVVIGDELKLEKCGAHRCAIQVERTGQRASTA